MLNYLQQRNAEICKLHEIYSNELPLFIKPIIESLEVLRLSGIGQHCGTEYVKIPMFKFKYFYSRLDHSLGVALIIWNFTKDKTQTIAGFLHDISSTVFAHVGDFLKKDYLNQEETESDTAKIISNSREIKNVLDDERIDISDVSDYKIYPIADNKSPKVCSDRLECTLHYPLIRGEWDLDDIHGIYKNVSVLKNEEGIDELGIIDIKSAEKITIMSIRNGIIDSSNEDKLCMQFLSDILELMIDKNIIFENDLLTMTEKQIIDKINNCDIKIIKDAWNYYENMIEVKMSDAPITDKYSVSLDVKKRYIDPLVKTKTGVYRISEISKDVREQIRTFKELQLSKHIFIDFPKLK